MTGISLVNKEIDSARKGIRLIFRNYSHWNELLCSFEWGGHKAVTLTFQIQNIHVRVRKSFLFSITRRTSGGWIDSVLFTNPVKSNGGVLWSLHKVEKENTRILEGTNSLFVLVGLVCMDS